MSLNLTRSTRRSRVPVSFANNSSRSCSMPLYFPSAPRKRVAGPLATSTTSSSDSPNGGTGRSVESLLHEVNVSSSAVAKMPSGRSLSQVKTSRSFMLNVRNCASQNSLWTASLVKYHTNRRGTEVAITALTRNQMVRETWHVGSNPTLSANSRSRVFFNNIIRVSGDLSKRGGIFNPQLSSTDNQIYLGNKISPMSMNR